MLGILTTSGSNACPYVRRSANKQRMALLAWRSLAAVKLDLMINSPVLALHILSQGCFSLALWFMFFESGDGVDFSAHELKLEL